MFDFPLIYQNLSLLDQSEKLVEIPISDRSVDDVMPIAKGALEYNLVIGFCGGRFFITDREQAEKLVGFIWFWS